MEIPLWAIQFLSGGMGGLVRGIVGVTKAQTFNPDTFKFRVYPEFYEGEIFYDYNNRFNDSRSDLPAMLRKAMQAGGGTYRKC